MRTAKEFYQEFRDKVDHLVTRIQLDQMAELRRLEEELNAEKSETCQLRIRDTFLVDELIRARGLLAWLWNAVNLPDDLHEVVAQHIAFVDHLMLRTQDTAEGKKPE